MTSFKKMTSKQNVPMEEEENCFEIKEETEEEIEVKKKKKAFDSCHIISFLIGFVIFSSSIINSIYFFYVPYQKRLENQKSIT